MIKILTKLVGLLVLVLAISCETDTVLSSRQRLAIEQELLQEFLESVPDSNNPAGLNYKDFWTLEAVDTIDKSLETGLIYFELETGTGKAVSVGNQVGYRYNRYVIARDSLDQPGLFWHSSDPSNYGYVDPDVFVAGSGSGVYSGVEQAILNMRKGGKSKVIVPSTVGDGSYITSVYDIEVTYISDN
ncbi:hypothetical protein [Saccharicrinis sp. 156]|uniref:hypothetical protein n=1 Tax=Saccharicrinis sp. 156 TaxID=3417574 RepID=UPI003D355D30